MVSLAINSQADFIQYIKDNSIGGRNLSVRGLADLCGVDRKFLREGGEFDSQKLTEKLTSSGFQGGELLQFGFCAQSAWLVIEYFAYESKAKAEGAKRLARLFGSIGVQTCFDLANPEPVVALPLPRQLPPIRDTRENLETSLMIKELDDPILRSYLMQSLYEEIGAKCLPAEKSHLVLAAVLARDLGYQLKPGEDSQLGKWVKRHHNPEGKAQHGRYEVNTYRRDQIEDTVHAYFR